LLQGAALDVLPTLAPGFDAVFVDADKAPLAQYFEWSVRLLRLGGLLLCDNAFFHGAVVDPADHSPDADGVRAFNRLAATDPRVVAAVVPIRDGLVVGVKVAA
jgi:predicted O-methyltransferase YrrM